MGISDWFHEKRRALAESILGDVVEEIAHQRALEYVEQERMWLSAEDKFLYEMGFGPPEAFTEARTVAEYSQEDIGWNSMRDRPGEISDARLREVRRQSRHAFYRIPVARNIIRNYTFLTVGSGVKLQYESDDAQERWDKWAEANNWPRFSKDTIRNTYLNGMWPIVFFPVQDTEVEGLPDGMTMEQFLGIDRIDDEDKADVGIKARGFDPEQILELVTTPGDSHEILAMRRNLITKEHGTKVVKHGKQDFVLPRVDVVGNGVLGRPILEVVLKPLSWFHFFLQDRVILNGMRTRLPIHRVIKGRGGLTAIQAEGRRFSTLPRPATVITTGEGEEWKYPDMKIQAGDAQPDGRAILLYIASGVNLPEFLVTMSAETANRASLQEAMDALKPMFDDFRCTFGDVFEDFGERIIGERPQAVWPQGEKRRSLEQVKSYSLAKADGIMSDHTYATKMGLNHDDEKKHQAEEREQRMELGLESIFQHRQFGPDDPPPRAEVRGMIEDDEARAAAAASSEDADVGTGAG